MRKSLFYQEQATLLRFIGGSLMFFSGLAVIFLADRKLMPSIGQELISLAGIILALAGLILAATGYIGLILLRLKGSVTTNEHRSH